MIVGLVCMCVWGEGGGMVLEDLDIWAGCTALCFSICTVEYQIIILVFLIVFSLPLLHYSQLSGNFYRLKAVSR